MATPLFDCLRLNYPDAKIIAVTRSYNFKIIDEHRSLDMVIPCDDKTLSGIFGLIKKVRELQADLAILLPHSMRSYLPFRLAGISTVIGYKRGIRRIFVMGPVPERDKRGFLPMPMVNYYLEICRWMGLTMPETIRPSFSIQQELRHKADSLLEEYGIKPGDMVIGLNPGAKFGSTKCWPPEHFAKLADLLEHRYKCRLLLFVGPGENEIASEIMKLTRSALINTGSEKIDLALLKPMIARCNLLVTNDTGPRHYAAALGVPVVVIMGPTDPRFTESNLEKTAVIRKELPCSPCHKKQCHEKHQCMRDIKPEEVLEVAEHLFCRVDKKVC
jgi:heptosyltransferase-2